MKKLYIIILLAFCFSTRIYADCSASENCGSCNSGNFTVQCQCHDVPKTFTCTSCTVPVNCSQPVCCCGINTKGQHYCSSASCAGYTGCTAGVFSHGPLVASTSNLGVAAALFQTGEIINLDAPVDINAASSGIDISDFKLNINHQGISGATFTIHNDSGKALVAYVIGIDFYWVNSPNKPCHGSVSEDSWFLNAEALAPGGLEPGRFATGITPNGTVSLARVVVSVELAEYSDGSVTGTNAAALQVKVAAARRDELSIQQHYAGMLKTGASPESVGQQIKTDAAKNMYKGNQRLAFATIEIELNQLGPDGLAKKLLEQPAIALTPQ